jgi:hypothetical protein
VVLLCETCCFIETVFKAAQAAPYESYLPVIKMLEAMARQRRIILYAGDCKVEDTEYILTEEKHYTVCHYFKCCNCEAYFFIGACIRGIPIYIILDNLNDEKLENMLWGKWGTRYNF